MTIINLVRKTWKKVWWDEILGIILAITIIVMIIAVARKGQTLDNVLLAGLIAVTTWYAYATIKIARATKQQAEASVKMAEEMREQRHDALRPIIDIVEEPLKPEEKIERILSAENGNPPKYVLCKLRNVGVGPAVEVYSFIEDAGGKPHRRDIGTIPVAIGEEEMGYTGAMRLSVIQRNNQSALVVKYKDVYGNPFKSIRGVSVNKDKGAVSISPLKVCSLSKKEHVNDS